jgi:putative FmdB family regulatory protein
MPTYDYECDACGHRFEMFQPITAKAVRKCPQCRKLKVRRLIGTGAGIIFKGSGFYCTDYRDKTYAAAAKKDQPPGAASVPTPGSGQGASDAAQKPDKPAESKSDKKASPDKNA